MDFWINCTTRLYLNGAHHLAIGGVVMRSLLQITMFFLSLGHWKAIHRKNGKAQDFPKGRWMKDEKAGAESPTGARSKLQ
jgi:hypothetical protein